MSELLNCEIAILGGGPGGYTAAFRAADLGKNVILIEKKERLGGVCLNEGCIPSKTLLHVAESLEGAEEAIAYGINFQIPSIDVDVLRSKKSSIVAKLTGGLMSLAKARNVRIVRGVGQFTSNKEITVTCDKRSTKIVFENAIIAVGSKPIMLPFLPNEDARIWNSTDALAIPFIPNRLAVLGGGIIGLEMAQVYSALGSKIFIIEMLNQLIPPADGDILRPLAAKLRKKYEAVYTSTKLTGVKAGKDCLTISLEGKDRPDSIDADVLLVAVGRKPNGQDIGIDDIGIDVDAQGFIKVNTQMETGVSGIYAIGDVTGNPMLAHKAAHEGKIAAEVIAGLKSAFTPMCIPSVAYTNPEIAWVGYTEKQAKEENITYEKGLFHWSASGRALSADKAVGLSKVLFDPDSGRIIGAGIIGTRAGDLIAEAGLAIEMGANAIDIGKTIHAHPTFSETLAFAAEMATGTITDALPPRKK